MKFREIVPHSRNNGSIISCFGNGAERISRNLSVVSGMERSGFLETYQLFREWSGADFSKLISCFGNGAERISRNLSVVSGMERSGFPETYQLFSYADFV